MGAKGSILRFKAAGPTMPENGFATTAGPRPLRGCVPACALAVGLLLATAGSASAGLPRLSAFRHSHKAVCSAPRAGFARCDAQVVTNASTATPLITPAPLGYGPADLQSAYALGTLAANNGSGATVAIVDAFDDPNAESDLATYRSQYGLPPCTTANSCFRKVNQSGGTTPPPSNAGWAEEISLDLDMVSAICPKCNILLVEATSNSTSNLDVAVDTAAGTAGVVAVSNSYGSTEGGDSSAEPHYNHSGVAITASSGDSGFGVEFPASSPHVTAVGGTTLNADASTTRGWTESAWSGAGSGCSSEFAKPAWQTDHACANRMVADVSAVADPNTGVAVFDTFGPNDNGWEVFGGTSAASPIVASFDALVGATSPNYPYSHLGSYNDVTSGSNGSCDPAYWCSGKSGFDGPTGLGSPNGVAGPAPAAPPSPPTTATGGSSSVTEASADVTGTVNPSGTGTTYHYEYGTATSYGSSTTEAALLTGSTDQAAPASLGSLTASTTYHYQLVASNCGGCAAGTILGGDGTLTTRPLPSATTNGASGVSTTAGTLNGTVNPNGSATTYHFDWGTSTSYGQQSPSADASAGSGVAGVAVSASLTGLAPSTTYHYRLVGTHCGGCAGGTRFGADVSFTTAGPPAVATQAASSVTAAGATLNGTVNPHGLATSYQFVYGTAPSSYTLGAAPASAQPLGFSDQATHSVSAALSGLAPGDYHYALMATNSASAGQVSGSDRIFTIPQPSSPVNTSGGGDSTSGAGSNTGTTGTSLPMPPGLPPVVIPPLSAPQVSEVLSSQKLGAALVHGLKLAVSCTTQCNISASLLLAKSTVASGGATMPVAGQKTVTLKFTKKARKALAKLRSVKLTLKVTGSNGAGGGQPLTRTVKLKR
jgi:hypothetical protein